jgi:hypothetical protein
MHGVIMISKTSKTKNKAAMSAEQPIEPAVEKPKKSPKKAAASLPQETAAISVPESVSEPQSEAQSHKKNKPEKVKVIRDSFSFPRQDYQKITELKKACLAEGLHVKKGEILRAGLHLLSQLSIEELKLAVARVEKVKTGRPNSTEN